ncbi:MAG TPA: DUF11 domain-containing protein [Gammaproteobacteria bacterium]|nr:DUF11 domain-containing protein [Gammaproteobacteria bacterium]
MKTSIRSFKPPLGALAAAVALALAVPGYASAATFIVNSTADSVDATPGDGTCADSSGACTLRAAVMEANALAGADTIDLTQINDPAQPIILTIKGVDETYEANSGGTGYVAVATHDASIGDLNITGDTTIVGAGSGKTIIEWSTADQADASGDRIFHIEAVDANITVAISGLTMRNGVTPPVVNIDPNPAQPEQKYSQFKRHGGCIAIGASAATSVFDPTVVHGSGSGGSGGGHGGQGGGEEGGGEEGFAVDGVTLTDVAVMNCLSGADGGGIYNAAPLVITDSLVSGNTATSNGGGIYSSATMDVVNTTIGTVTTNAATLPNHAENGGGIFDTGLHTTTITGSALVGNTATGGGALAGRSTSIDNILDTTISDNVARDTAGGLTTNGRINLTNVTLANNKVVPTSDSEEGGAGVGLSSFASGQITYVNTIIANNVLETTTATTLSNCGSTGEGSTTTKLISSGHNLEDGDSCNLTKTGDLKNTDPKLGALTNNGGLTETMAIPQSSPAIDAGDNTVCPNNDQRGELRPADGNLDGTFVCDIGAFELFIHTADVHINDMVAPDSVFATDGIELTIQVHNDPTATTAATGVSIATAPLPADFKLSSANLTTSSGTTACGVASGVVTCNVGSLAVGAQATATLRGTSSSPGTLSIAGTVSSVTPIDTNTGNNSDHVHIAVIGNSDMAVTASGATGLLAAGSSTTLSFTVTNKGPNAATAARVAAFLPAGFTYQSATIGKGSCSYSSADNTVECTIGSLANGASVTGSMVVKVAPSTANSVLFGVDSVERDVNAANDAATVPLRSAGQSSSGGGCSYRPNSPFDPTLPGLLAAGVLGLWFRSRLRRAAGRI